MKYFNQRVPYVSPFRMKKVRARYMKAMIKHKKQIVKEMKKFTGKRDFNPQPIPKMPNGVDSQLYVHKV